MVAFHASLCRRPLSLPSVFVFLQPTTVLLVSNKEGNSSHSVAQLSNVLIDGGQTHTNAHHTITNSQLWLMEGVNPLFKRSRAKGEYVPRGRRKRKKSGGVVIFHNGVQKPTWPYFLLAHGGAWSRAGCGEKRRGGG